MASYDVSCKYAIHWLKRLREIARLTRLSIFPDKWPKIISLVPKWHAFAHTGVCRWLNSFYYTPGVGMTDGEAPERRWAILNAIGRSTREMGPGHRQDTINDHNSDHNIRKLFKIGKPFLLLLFRVILMTELPSANSQRASCRCRAIGHETPPRTQWIRGNTSREWSSS